MRTLFLFLILLALPFLGSAQDWIQDDSKTEVTFKIKKMGLYVDGQFNKIDFKSNLDINNLQSSFIKGTLQVISVKTGVEARDKHLYTNEFFDEPAHKTIRFTSSKITKGKNGYYEMEGLLRIKKTIKPITIPIAISQTKNKLEINAEFELDRMDFDVGVAYLILSKKVKIKVRYVAEKP